MAQHLLTTLRRIKNQSPDKNLWGHILYCLDAKQANNKTIFLSDINRFCGIRAALWALGSIERKYEEAIRLYGCRIARGHMSDWDSAFPDDQRLHVALNVAESFALKGGDVKDLKKCKDMAGEAMGISHLAGRMDANTAATLVWYVLDPPDEVGKGNDGMFCRARMESWGYDSPWQKDPMEFRRLCILEDDYQKTVRRL